MEASPDRPSVACSLTRAEVMWTVQYGGVPLIDGCCNNWTTKNGTRVRCVCPLVEHQSASTDMTEENIKKLVRSILRDLKRKKQPPQTASGAIFTIYEEMENENEMVTSLEGAQKKRPQSR